MYICLCNGLTDSQIAACLTDGAALARMGQAAQRAQQLGVEGTPTFFLNGEKLDIASWNELLVRLRQP